MSYLIPRPFVVEDSFDVDIDALKPAKSMELSLVSSADTNDFSAVFSQDSEDENGDMNHSMVVACELVHSILNQVAWNDFPPTNESIEYNDNPLRFSRQCHVGPASSQPWSSHNPTEAKMGNVALATLCARTLELVGRSVEPVNSSHLNGARKMVHAKTTGNTKRRTWMKRQLRNPPRFAEIVMSPHNASTKTKDSHTFTKPLERRKPAELSNKEEQENEAPSLRPLQMFGSEYARHLSTTHFAPKEVVLSTRGTSVPRPKIHAPQDTDRIRNIEDAELSALTGPITDILITVGQESPPNGYFRISQSAGGEAFVLRDHRSPYHLNVKKETNWDRAAQRPCVVALAVIFPQRQEFVPPGFSVVRVHSNVHKSNDPVPANLNVAGEQAFLCFRRSREGNPITAILPLIPSKQEGIPEGFTVVEKTPRNHVAAIQTQSTQVFLAYRQRLANLEPLRPIPLVLAAYNAPSSSKKLECYYSTGGTIVTSQVGRFHIMDRSTHSLLSPSSVSNRLALIEASRQKTQSALDADARETYAYSDNAAWNTAASSESLASSLLLSQRPTAPSHLSHGWHATDFESERSVEMSATLSLTDQDIHRVASPVMEGNFKGPNRFEPGTTSSVASEDQIDRRLEVLSFIPVVSTAVEENDSMAMLRFRARVVILTPILTSCYTRHGRSSQVAAEGLLNLLKQGFFSSDVDLEEVSCDRITLLDIAIQVVCDIATTGAEETHLLPCVEFVQAAVKYGCGHLSTRTVGYVLRFYLFVFYFGMTAPSGGTLAWGTLNRHDHFLLQDPRNSTVTYLPGGAPQASVLALKDLVSFSIARLKALVTSERMLFRFKSPTKTTSTAPDVFNQLIGEIVGDMVDQSVDRVDIANYTQLALHQVQRSGGSELFWYDMILSCGSGLFGRDEVLQAETRRMFSMVFAIMAHCVKVASTNIRKDTDSQGLPRDVSSKLLNLELVNFFLVTWDVMKHDVPDIPNVRSFSTFVFAIRRLVVPCLLQNTEAAIEDPRVYRRVLRIISSLWTSSMYRKEMKLELGILVDQFAIRVFNLGPQILFKENSKNSDNETYLFAQQIELLKTLLAWFSDPRGVLELFMNYGMDVEDQALGSPSSKDFLSGGRWKIAQKLCAALCNLAEKCGEFIARQIRESNALTAAHYGEDVEVLEGMSDTTLARESAKRLRKAALAVIERIVRSVAESAAAAKGPRYNAVVDAWGTRPKDHLDLPQILSSDSDEDGSLNKKIGKEGGILGYWQQAIAQKGVTSVGAMAKFAESDNSKVDHVGIAFEIAQEKGLRKAIDYLILCNILTASPRDIASFLRFHRSEVDPVTLGAYLSEPGSDSTEADYWNLIRFNFIRPISFVGMTLDQGLRHLLSNGGFRLPGEAQQIDRILTTFAKCYWEDNAGDRINCPFKDQDTVFVLSFAIIMLNSDLHKVLSKGKNRTVKRMSKSEFISNLKGVSTQSDGMNPTYLSSLYDSIYTHPIALEENAGHPGSVSDKVESELAALTRNAKNLDSLLRAFSTRQYNFLSIEEYGQKTLVCASLRDTTALLAHQMVSQTWHQFYGLINTIVDVAHVDLEGLTLCTSILKYALASTICLDMPLERSAFLVQLGRVRAFHAFRRSECSYMSAEQEIPRSFQSEDWYTGIQEACTWNPDNPRMDKDRLMALKLIDELVLDMTLDAHPKEIGRQET